MKAKQKHAECFTRKRAAAMLMYKNKKKTPQISVKSDFNSLCGNSECFHFILLLLDIYSFYFQYAKLLADPFCTRSHCGFCDILMNCSALF